MFTFENLKFSFSYEDYDVHTAYGEYMEMRYTICEISKIEEGNKEGQQLVRAKVNCYFRDNYSKIRGRKEALAAAIKLMKENYSLSKNTSRDIWNKYFEISPRSKNKC